MNFRGFVAAISSRKVGRKNSMAYSFRLENPDGSDFEYEGKTWIGFGFESPPFKEGDFIEGEVETNENGYPQYVKGTGKQVKNPPARAGAKPAVQSDGPKSDGVATGGPVSDVADRQTQIVMQHSQEMAISAVDVLLKHDGLPMSGAKTAAGVAKREAEIRAYIRKLTRAFYDEVVTGSLLTTEAPEIVSTAPDAPLPEPPAKAKTKKVKVGDDRNEPGVF